MIPIRDANPSQGTPVINYLVIALCTLAFFYEMLLGRQLHIFLMQFGLVPVRYSQPDIAGHFTWPFYVDRASTAVYDIHVSARGMAPSHR